MPFSPRRNGAASTDSRPRLYAASERFWSEWPAARRIVEESDLGLLSGLLGLASDVDVEGVRRDLEPILIPNEEVDLAFSVVRDLIVFTSHRLILIDKQGMTGRKRDIHSIPYRSITMFSVETAGSFDADAELTIWISSQASPITRQLSRGSNVAGIQRALAIGSLERK